MLRFLYIETQRTCIIFSLSVLQLPPPPQQRPPKPNQARPSAPPEYESDPPPAYQSSGPPQPQSSMNQLGTFHQQLCLVYCLQFICHCQLCQCA